MTAPIQADTVRAHPRVRVACNSSGCHSDGKLGQFHDMPIDEADPAASCAVSGCHDLGKAGKTPFWVTG